MALRRLLSTYRVYILIGLIVLGSGYYYFFVRSSNTSTAATSFYIIDTVSHGEVSSGIRSTGEIIAEQKLDLDVYKQLSRIAVVNAANGGHVEKGDTLVSFDKSDALVNTQTSRVALSEAELALQVERANAEDPNTKARTLEKQIAEYKRSIANAAQDNTDAYTDFLNADLEVAPQKNQESRLADKSLPVLGGKYIGTAKGQYTIEIYSSAAESGYSFHLTGLETNTESISFGKAVDLGARGLTITFPTDIRAGDIWVVEVPNITIASYAETERAYTQKVADLQVALQGYQINLQNAEQDLKDTLTTDSGAYRDINVEKAALSVSSEQQKLARNYDVLKERDIVAPFAGTIQDMTNVVVGATPTGGTSDTINLGTLISDTFLTTFALSAADVAKISIGQKVKVTVTSFAEQPTFEGTISEISSLPSEDGVAQYTVRAKLNYDRAKAHIVLREGVLADIEVVQEEKSDALRIPISALSYESGKPSVKVVESLTEPQKAEIASRGIVRLDAGSTLPSHTVQVELGIQGKYYVEVTKGLTEGTYILTTATTPAASASVVEQRGPRGGGGNGQNTQQGTNR